LAILRKKSTLWFISLREAGLPATEKGIFQNPSVQANPVSKARNRANALRNGDPTEVAPMMIVAMRVTVGSAQKRSRITGRGRGKSRISEEKKTPYSECSK
jgi:hypothetical protein